MSAAPMWNSPYSFTEQSFNVRPAGQNSGSLDGSERSTRRSTINSRDFTDGEDAAFSWRIKKVERATQRSESRIQERAVDPTQFTIVPDLELLLVKQI